MLCARFAIFCCQLHCTLYHGKGNGVGSDNLLAACCFAVIFISSRSKPCGNLVSRGVSTVSFQCFWFSGSTLQSLLDIPLIGYLCLAACHLYRQHRRTVVPLQNFFLALCNRRLGSKADGFTSQRCDPVLSHKHMDGRKHRTLTQHELIALAVRLRQNRNIGIAKTV